MNCLNYTRNTTAVSQLSKWQISMHFSKISDKVQNLCQKNETLAALIFQSFQTTDPIFCMDKSTNPSAQGKNSSGGCDLSEQVLLSETAAKFSFRSVRRRGLNQLYAAPLLLFKAWHSAFILYESPLRTLNAITPPQQEKRQSHRIRRKTSLRPILKNNGGNSGSTFWGAFSRSHLMTRRA